MSESKEYVSQTLEHGAIHISEEVIATIAALAVQDVEGVYGLNTTLSSSELSKLAKRAQQGKGIRLVISEDDEISVDCYIVDRHQRGGIHHRPQGEERQRQHQRHHPAPAC